MAPPPSTPLLTKPLLSVKSFIVKFAPGSTSKNRNSGTPLAVDLAIVAPFPSMTTVFVITGTPFPPSVLLSGALSV